VERIRELMSIELINVVGTCSREQEACYTHPGQEMAVLSYQELLSSVLLFFP
jgi:hypothetical protein